MTREDFSFPSPAKAYRSKPWPFPFLPSIQVQFPWDVIGDHNAGDLMVLFSFLGVPAPPLGHRLIHSRRAQALLRHMPGPDANAMQPLCIRGRSVPYHMRHEGPRALGGGWLQGQAAGTAVTQPCVHTKGLQLRHQQLPGTKTQAEGCKYTFLWMLLALPGWEE